MSVAWLQCASNARRIVDTNEPMRDRSLCFWERNGFGCSLDAPLQ